MSGLAKLMLSSILITLIVLGLNSPVAAQLPPPPTIYVEAPSFVNVSTEFDVIIWIRDIPSGWGLVYFDFGLTWDPNNLEYIGCEFLGDGRPGWDGGCSGEPTMGRGGGGGSDLRNFPAARWTQDAAWLRFRFHCLREGVAIITVSSGDTIDLENSGGSVVPFLYEPITVTVEQGFGAVGGISTPINKLEILTPYLALAGLVIAVSTVYVFKRRKD
jgi:hypothetical protein